MESQALAAKIPPSVLSLAAIVRTIVMIPHKINLAHPLVLHREGTVALIVVRLTSPRVYIVKGAKVREYYSDSAGTDRLE